MGRREDGGQRKGGLADGGQMDGEWPDRRAAHEERQTGQRADRWRRADRGRIGRTSGGLGGWGVD